MVKTNKENQKATKKISIQVSLDGFSFCTLDTQEQQIVFFREKSFGKRLNPMEVLERIEKLYLEEELLRSASAEVELLFSNQLYSVIPTKLYSEENASDFLKFNARMLQTDVVAKDFVGDDLVNVYIPYTNILNYFFDMYGEFQYRHSVSVLVEALQKESTSKPGTTFYANLNETGFDLVVISDARLLLANSFHCETKEDFLYYLLFTAEQLDKDPEIFDLVLLGKITEDSEYYETAYSYIRNIGLMDISFGYSYAGIDMPPKALQHYCLLESLT